MSFNKDLTIGHNATIVETLKKLEQNKMNIVFIISDDEVLVGVASDGDIRRGLLSGQQMSDCVQSVMNRDFAFANYGAPRENILKLLDQNVHVLPLLNENNKIIDVVSKNNFGASPTAPIIVRSRAPVRVSFCGGGSDLTHYFIDKPGAVINAALSIYCNVAIRKSLDGKIRITSQELKISYVAEKRDQLSNAPSELRLIKAIIDFVNPDFGFDLSIQSDFEPGSGLGGSATVTVAILECFNRLLGLGWTKFELAEYAFQIERFDVGVAGGWQDQYAAAIGGLNFMKFSMNKTSVLPLRLPTETLQELESCLILCDTKLSHDSNHMHGDQKQTMADEKVRQLVDDSVELTYKMQEYLLRGEFAKFGEGLDIAWNLKQKFGSKITNEVVNDVYSIAKEAGVLGGKLLGAGGGGYFLFYCPPFKKHAIIEHLNSKLIFSKNLCFDHSGVTSWIVRDETV